MFKLFKYILVLLVIVAQIQIAQSQSSDDENAIDPDNYDIMRMPGARIVATSCDPLTDEVNDNLRVNSDSIDGRYPKKSCVGQNITLYGGEGSGNLDEKPFEILVEFHPSSPKGGGEFEVLIQGEIDFPNGLSAPFYDEDGAELTGVTVGDLTLPSNEGEPILYNGEPIYSAPVFLKYPPTCDPQNPNLYKEGGSNICPVMEEVPVNGCDLLDEECERTYEPLIYESGEITQNSEGEDVESTTCNGNNVGDIIYYELGEPVYSSDCTIQKDCRGQDMIGGDYVYMEDPTDNNNCNQKVFYGSQILAIKTPSTTVTVEGSLFNAIFKDYYTSDVKIGIETLKSKQVWIKANDSNLTIHPTTLFGFSSSVEGRSVCITASHPFDRSKEWRVEKSDTPPQTVDEVFYRIEIDQENEDGEAEKAYKDIDPDMIEQKHCVTAPDPTPPAYTLKWGGVIAKTCTSYDSHNAQWLMPFTSIVVHCIEETVKNMLLPGNIELIRNSDGEVVDSASFFTNVQDKLVGFVRALLALYIIVFGYRLMIGKSAPKRGEWIMYVIKFAFVIYFAVGSGMTYLTPMLLDLSKGLSTIFLEAGLSGQTEEQAKLNFENNLAQNEVNFKENEIRLAKNSIDALSKQKEDKEKEKEDKEEELQNINNNISNTDLSALENKKAQAEAEYNTADTNIKNAESIECIDAVALPININESSFKKTCRDKDSKLREAVKKLLDAQNDLTNLNNEKNAVEDEISDLTQEIESINQRTPTAAQIAALEQELEQLKINSKDKADALQEYLSNSSDDGQQIQSYNYCDFRNVDYGDHPSYRLWDIIDCKVSKYLGLGGNQSHFEDFKNPYMLTIAIKSIFTSYLGVPLFIVTFAVLVVMLQLVVRVVSIYILAVVAVFLLTFIAPLIVPTLLFKFTKDIFTRWASQILSALIQPVILFAFLGFIFMLLDITILRGNHDFVPIKKEIYEQMHKERIKNNDSQQENYVPQPVNYFIADVENPSKIATKYSECADESSIVCGYQSITFNKYPGILGLITNHTVGFDDKADDYLIGLLKMFLIFFMINMMLESVMALSGKLVGAIKGGNKSGLDSVASTHVSSPTKVANFAAQAPSRLGQIASSPFRAKENAVAAKKRIGETIGKSLLEKGEESKSSIKNAYKKGQNQSKKKK